MIKSIEYDKNFYEGERCNNCYQEFDSYERCFIMSNCADGGEMFICQECIKEIMAFLENDFKSREDKQCEIEVEADKQSDTGERFDVEEFFDNENM